MNKTLLLFSSHGEMGNVSNAENCAEKKIIFTFIANSNCIFISQAKQNETEENFLIFAQSTSET